MLARVRVSPTIKHIPISTFLFSSLPLLAQTSNSNLPRADLQLSTVAGVHNNVANNNLDAGFTMFKVAAPKQARSDRSATLVATSRLMYVAYADLIGSNIAIQFRRSTDGGRTASSTSTSARATATPPTTASIPAASTRRCAPRCSSAARSR